MRAGSRGSRDVAGWDSRLGPPATTEPAGAAPPAPPRHPEPPPPPAGGGGGGPVGPVGALRPQRRSPAVTSTTSSKDPVKTVKPACVCAWPLCATSWVSGQSARPPVTLKARHPYFSMAASGSAVPRNTLSYSIPMKRYNVFSVERGREKERRRGRGKKLAARARANSHVASPSFHYRRLWWFIVPTEVNFKSGRGLKVGHPGRAGAAGGITKGCAQSSRTPRRARLGPWASPRKPACRGAGPLANLGVRRGGVALLNNASRRENKPRHSEQKSAIRHSFVISFRPLPR